MNGKLRRSAVVRACVAIGLVAIMALALPRPAHAEAKALNNLVTELLTVQAPQAEARQTYRFSNPKDGWVFFSSVASTKDGGSVYLVVNSENRDDAITVHDHGRYDRKEAINADPEQMDPAKEAVRHLAAGEHTLNVFCEGGAALQGLAVRSIPEMLYAETGYRPSRFMPSYPPFTWEFLERIGLAEVINVVVERQVEPYMHWEQWRREGKRILEYSNLFWIPGLQEIKTADDSYYDYWTTRQGMTNPRYDGIILDEFSTGSAQLYPSQTRAVELISENPQFKDKLLYAYASALYGAEHSKAFAQALFDAGYKLVNERYLREQPTEAEALKSIEGRIGQDMMHYREALPGCEKQTVMCLAYMSAPPESCDTHPNVNYKVFLDMQFNFIANDPAFAGLYGIMCYHSAFADEEVIRWTAKLYRHYCLEGKTEMLLKDPYILPHIQNPDFADGAAGWALSPAEEGSMAVKSATKYSWLQGRYPPTDQGDTFLWAKRSAKAPNRFSQEIVALDPGRLYSLKMFTSDYQDLVQGREVKQMHKVSIRIDDVDRLPGNSFHDVFPSGRAGHAYGKFNRENNLWISYHNLVFRAREKSARLTISDWETGEEPGGPIGQELIFNFIQIQPYLED